MWTCLWNFYEFPYNAITFVYFTLYTLLFSQNTAVCEREKLKKFLRNKTKRRRTFYSHSLPLNGQREKNALNPLPRSTLFILPLWMQCCTTFKGNTAKYLLDFHLISLWIFFLFFPTFLFSFLSYSIPELEVWNCIWLAG
jgi:hypothetical protein